MGKQRLTKTQLDSITVKSDAIEIAELRGMGWNDEDIKELQKIGHIDADELRKIIMNITDGYPNKKGSLYVIDPQNTSNYNEREIDNISAKLIESVLQYKSFRMEYENAKKRLSDEVSSKIIFVKTDTRLTKAQRTDIAIEYDNKAVQIRNELTQLMTEFIESEPSLNDAGLRTIPSKDIIINDYILKRSNNIGKVQVDDLQSIQIEFELPNIDGDNDKKLSKRRFVYQYIKGLSAKKTGLRENRIYAQPLTIKAGPFITDGKFSHTYGFNLINIKDIIPNENKDFETITLKDEDDKTGKMTIRTMTVKKNIYGVEFTEKELEFFNLNLRDNRIAEPSLWGFYTSKGKPPPKINEDTEEYVNDNNLDINNQNVTEFDAFNIPTKNGVIAGENVNTPSVETSQIISDTNTGMDPSKMDNGNIRIDYEKNFRMCPKGVREINSTAKEVLPLFNFLSQPKIRENLHRLGLNVFVKAHHIARISGTQGYATRELLSKPNLDILLESQAITCLTNIILADAENNKNALESKILTIKLKFGIHGDKELLLCKFPMSNLIRKTIWSEPTVSNLSEKPTIITVSSIKTHQEIFKGRGQAKEPENQLYIWESYMEQKGKYNDSNYITNLNKIRENTEGNEWKMNNIFLLAMPKDKNANTKKVITNGGKLSTTKPVNQINTFKKSVNIYETNSVIYDSSNSPTSYTWLDDILQLSIDRFLDHRSAIEKVLLLKKKQSTGGKSLTWLEVLKAYKIYNGIPDADHITKKDVLLSYFRPRVSRRKKIASDYQPYGKEITVTELKEINRLGDLKKQYAYDVTNAISEIIITLTDEDNEEEEYTLTYKSKQKLLDDSDISPGMSEEEETEKALLEESNPNLNFRDKGILTPQYFFGVNHGSEINLEPFPLKPVVGYNSRVKKEDKEGKKGK